MEIGIVGLGRMGMNMALRLLSKGHQVVAFNRTPQKTKELAKKGARAAFSVEELVRALSPPRIIWLMLPAGSVVDQHIKKISALATIGDTIIDGGNTYYRDDLRRAPELASKGLHYVDVGVSGGIWGLELGYCLMVGGDRELFHRLEPIFQALAPKEGYIYCGPNGAGHFVKMIHNGIEYAMMQALAEGFEILQSSPYGQGIGLSQLAHVWNRGSVIRSWLLELAERAFGRDPDLSAIKGYVEDSGEGRWTVKEAVDLAVSAPVISLSLFERFRSRKEDTFSNKLLAALRKEFGGHEIKEPDPKGNPRP